MIDVVLLDAGPLGMIAHPRASVEIVTWLANVLAEGIQVWIPEIADYEVRRELLRVRKSKSIRRLDQLKATLGFVPISSNAMIRAAEFWAETRRKGQPTAHPSSLDADVILAGQAATLDSSTIVATTNPKHLSRLVPAEHWQKIIP